MYTNIRNYRTILFFFSALLCSANVQAGSQAGKNIVLNGNKHGATACVACHGQNGAGNEAAGFPRLAGLNAAYLRKQLHDYAQGIRVNATMQPIAKALSKQDISAVSEYFAALKPPAPTNNSKSDEMSDGKNLVERGIWSKGVPACVQCHGPGARGVGKDFPAIAGQHKSYLVAQLNAWKDGQRKNDPLELMHGIASSLSEKQIKEVSAYLSSMKASAN